MKDIFIYCSCSAGIECLILSQPRWKKSQRCTLHSLEAGSARGWGASGACAWGWGAWGWGGRAAWRTAWDAMRSVTREHVTLIHFNTLHDTLHNYLRKHRFCADCKTKVSCSYIVTFKDWLMYTYSSWIFIISCPLFISNKLLLFFHLLKKMLKRC